MIKVLISAGLVAVAAPAYAQDMHHSGTTYQDGQKGHSESDKAGTLRLAETPELSQALAQGGEPIVATVLGVVCDFCAKAMNKTFGKRDDVAAVHVDLDTKTLNLVLSPGAIMDDKALRKLVKKSGYKVDIIARGESVTTG